MKSKLKELKREVVNHSFQKALKNHKLHTLNTQKMLFEIIIMIRLFFKVLINFIIEINVK